MKKSTIYKNYPKNLVNGMNGHAFKKFMLWLNRWADHEEYKNRRDCYEDDKLTKFGEGYKRAISDVFNYCQEKGHKPK